MKRRQRNITITSASAGNRRQPDRSSGGAYAAADAQLKVLHERINSLKLEHAKQLAQDKMDWNSGNPRDTFKVIVAGGLVLKELERQIKEAELQVEALHKVQVERDLHPTASQKDQDSYIEKLLLDRDLTRIETLKMLAQKHPDMPHRDLCGLFDEYELDVPPYWKRGGIKSWVEGFDNSRFRLNAHSVIGKYRKRPRQKK